MDRIIIMTTGTGLRITQGQRNSLEEIYFSLALLETRITSSQQEQALFMMIFMRREIGETLQGMMNNFIRLEKEQKSFQGLSSNILGQQMKGYLL